MMVCTMSNWGRTRLLTESKTKRIGPQSRSGWACVGRVLYWDEILSRCRAAVCRFRRQLTVMMVMAMAMRVVIRDEVWDVCMALDCGAKREKEGGDGVDAPGIKEVELNGHAAQRLRAKGKRQRGREGESARGGATGSHAEPTGARAEPMRCAACWLAPALSVSAKAPSAC